MFPLMIPLLGAGLGALTNKKNPLKGALMGGALGAGGAAIAPGIAGAMGGASSGAASLAALPDAAPGLAQMGMAGPESFAAPGMFDKFKGLLDTSSQYAKPVGDAMGAANAANGLLSQPQQQPPMVQQGGGPGVGQAMGGIVQNQQQLDQQRMAEARKRMGLLGGPYG